MPTVKVRILSGSQRGAVLDMDRTEAEINIASGFAEFVPGGPREPKVVVQEPEEDSDFVIDDKPRRRSRRSEAESDE